jgi:hypothetical protein
MQLEQYVSEILTSGLHPTGFPDYLDIPKVLVDYAGDQGYGISVWYYKYLRLNGRTP